MVVGAVECSKEEDDGNSYSSTCDVHNNSRVVAVGGSGGGYYNGKRIPPPSVAATASSTVVTTVIDNGNNNDGSTTTGSSSTTQVKIRHQIHEIRSDMKNVVDEMIVGRRHAVSSVVGRYCLDPIVNIFVDPVLGIGEDTLPIVASTIPFADHVIGLSLGGTSNIGHAIYGIFHHQVQEHGLQRQEESTTTTTPPATTTSRGRGIVANQLKEKYYNVAENFDDFFNDDDEEEEDEDDGDDVEKENAQLLDVNNNANNKNLIDVVIQSLIAMVMGITFAMLGITWNTLQHLLPNHPLVKWIQTCHDLKVFLKKAGMVLGGDMDILFEDLLPNLMLLSKLQTKVFPNRGDDDRIQSEHMASQSQIEDGYYYMRYASAAYAMTTVDRRDVLRRQQRQRNRQQQQDINVAEDDGGILDMEHEHDLQLEEEAEKEEEKQLVEKAKSRGGLFKDNKLFVGDIGNGQKNNRSNHPHPILKIFQPKEEDDKVKKDDDVDDVDKEYKKLMYQIDEPYEMEARRIICNYCSANGLLKENDIVMFVKQPPLKTRLKLRSSDGDGLLDNRQRRRRRNRYKRVLRHFVAVDHSKKSIVLSIRGTFTFAELIVKKGESKISEFCNGSGCYAPSGLIEQTNELWNVVGDIILERIKQYPNYDLILVGHSLGGAIACLLTIKIHVERLLDRNTDDPLVEIQRRFLNWSPKNKNNQDSSSPLQSSSPLSIFTPNNQKTKVKCYAYGPPAMFSLGTDTNKSSSAMIEEAMANITCYIHDDDCVPTMSLSSIKNFKQRLQVIQSKRKKTKGDDNNSMDIVGRMIVGDNSCEIDDNDNDYGELRRELLATMAPSSEATTTITTSSRGWLFDKMDGDTTISASNGDTKSNQELSFILPSKSIVWMRGCVGRGYKAFLFHDQPGATSSSIPLLLSDVYVDVDMFNDHKPTYYEQALESLLLLVEKE